MAHEAIAPAFAQLRAPGDRTPRFGRAWRNTRTITSGVPEQPPGNIHPQAVDGIIAGTPRCEWPGDLEFHS
jgi:hypothetical protein